MPVQVPCCFSFFLVLILSWSSGTFGVLFPAELWLNTFLFGMNFNRWLSRRVWEIRWWRFAANGVFSVSSAYDLFFLTSTKCPFGEAIWKTKAPARVRFFLWLAAKGRCLTADNLSKRGWPHNPDCLLCLSAPEDCKTFSPAAPTLTGFGHFWELGWVLALICLAEVEKNWRFGGSVRAAVVGLATEMLLTPSSC